MERALPADITSKWLHDNVYDQALRALRMSLDSPFAVDSIFASGEVVDIGPGEYKGMMVGGYETTTNVFTPLTFSNDGRLRVDAEISIQSVEIEVETDALDGDTMGMFAFPNGDSNATPVPINVTANGHLRVVPGYAGIETNFYNELNIDPLDEEILLTYVIPVSTVFQVLLVSCSGTGDGKFKVKKNGNTISCKRNSWSNRNVEFEFLYGFKLNAGDIIEVTAENVGEETHEFNANFYGEADG